LVIVFCKIDKLPLLNTKLINTLIKINYSLTATFDFFNKFCVLIDGDFKFGVLLLVFVHFLGGDTGNLYRNVFL
jgi:hypothetical protein